MIQSELNNKETSDEVEVIGSESTSESEEETEDTDRNQENEKNNESKTETDTQKNDDYIHIEPEKTIFDARGAVYELKKTTDAIKQNNINIDTEEIEFDDYYQITIKIKK